MADTRSYGSLTVDEQTYKLPATVRPDRYQIRLTPDLTAFTFAGEETVAIQVLEPTTEIILNAAELQVHSATVISQNGRASTGTIVLDEINERAVFTFPEPLVPGSYQLRLTF